MSGEGRRPGGETPGLTHQRAEELISDRLDGPLDAASQAALSAHLAGCASCGYFAAQMGVMGDGLRELPRLPASPTVARQVRERIAQPATLWDRLGQRLSGQLGLAPVAATAALLVAVVAGALLLDRDGDGTADNPTVLASTQISIDRTLTSTRATGEPTATPVPGIVLPTETPETTPLPNIRFEPSAIPTETPVPAATETPVPTLAPSETPVPEATATAVPTDIPASTATEVPPTATPTDEPTEIPTATEIPPTETATRVPTEEPTETPTEEPTEEPTETPTEEPTEEPDTATPEPTVQGAPTIGPMGGDPTDPEPIDDPDETPGEQATDEPNAGDATETPDDGGQDNELIIEPTDGTVDGDDPVETPEGDTGGPTDGTATEDIPADETPEDVADQGPEAVLDETSRIVSLPEGSSAPIGELAFSPDGRLMVVSDESGLSLRVVDRTTGGELLQLGAGAYPLWSPGSGALLFQDVGGDAGRVTLYWAPDNSIFSISDPSEGSVTDVPAGWVGATAYYLRTYDTGRIELRAWDANSGISLGQVWGSDDAQLTGARPLQTNAGFLIPTPGAWLLVTPDGFAQEVGGNPFGFVSDGRLSPDGSLLAIATGDGLTIANAASPGNVVATLPYAEAPGAGFSWSPDGASLAVSDGASIAVYTSGGELVGTATSETGITVAGLQFQPDGIYFVQTSGEPSLRRFDVNRLRP